MFLDALIVPFGNDLHGVGIGGLHLLTAPDGYTFQVLGTHDRPHAGPAVEVLHVVAHIGEPDQPFPGLADGGHPDLGVARLGLQGFQGLKIIQTPEVSGVFDGDLPVLNVQIDGIGGPAGDDQGIEAGKFEFRTKVAPGLGFAEIAGQWGFGGHGVAVESGDGNPGNYAGGKDKDIVRGQGICSRFEHFQKIIRGKGGTAHVGPVPAFIRLFHRRGMVGQINMQDFSIESKRHWSTPFKFGINLSESTVGNK